MTKTVDVAPGQLIQSAWGKQVRDRSTQVFTSLTDLTTNWATAPVGAKAVTTDTFRAYTHRAAGAAGWQPDLAYGLQSVTFTAGSGPLNHDLGRAPAWCVVAPGQSLGGSTTSVTILGVLNLNPAAGQVTLGCWIATTGGTFAGARNVFYVLGG